jgi:hypothetical protein
MIGSGIPKIQSNAPLPKPMFASIFLLAGYCEPSTCGTTLGSIMGNCVATKPQSRSRNHEIALSCAQS